MDLKKIREQVEAIDPEPWRADFDEDDMLVIWFHADLERDPRRIIISFGADKPSKNELAAAEFLVNSREYVRWLLNEVERQAQLLLGYELMVVDKMPAETLGLRDRE